MDPGALTDVRALLARTTFAERMLQRNALFHCSYEKFSDEFRYCHKTMVLFGICSRLVAAPDRAAKPSRHRLDPCGAQGREKPGQSRDA